MDMFRIATRASRGLLYGGVTGLMLGGLGNVVTQLFSLDAPPPWTALGAEVITNWKAIEAIFHCTDGLSLMHEFRDVHSEALNNAILQLSLLTRASTDTFLTPIERTAIMLTTAKNMDRNFRLFVVWIRQTNIPRDIAEEITTVSIQIHVKAEQIIDDSRFV